MVIGKPAARETIQIADVQLVHADGDVSAVVATEDMDVTALDGTRRAAVLAAFTRLCETTDSPLQLVARVRPVIAETTAPRDAHAALDTAMREHWRHHVTTLQPQARTVYIATRAPSSRALDAQVERVLATTRAMGVGGARLCGDDLRAIVSEDGATACWRSSPHHARLSDTFVHGIALRSFPGAAVDPGWLAPLLATAVACDIAIHMTPVAVGDALHTLGRRMRDTSAHQLLEGERGVLADVHVDIAAGAARALRDRLARNTSRPLQLAIVATVRAPTLELLQHARTLLRDAFRACGITAEPAHFRHVDAYLTTLPLARDALHRGKLVDAASAATCVPWTHAGCADADGYRLGVALRSRHPVRVSPFDTRAHRNANIAVLAASGHGKSFAVGALVLEAATHGVPAIIVDPEGEYGAVVDALQGACWRVAPGSGTALNVFDTGEDQDEAVAAVTDLVSVMCGGVLDQAERAAVHAAARWAQQDADRRRATPLLGDCLPRLQGGRNVTAVLERYCSGGLGALFNRPTSFAVRGDVTAVSLVDMPDEHVPAATMLLARWLWAMIRRDRRRRHVVFDEVGALSVHAPLRALLVQLARRCRKYGASLVVATQNAQDLLATDEGRVVATNCATLLLGGHRPAETALMEEAFGLTPAQRRFLETSGRGEFLLMAGDRRVEMRVEVPELHRSILATTP